MNVYLIRHSVVIVRENSRDEDAQEIGEESDYPYSEDEVEGKVVAC